MPLRKKKKSKPDFPCSCGHSKRLHYESGPPIWEDWCAAKPWCDCEKYVPGNLKYLEMKYKKGKNDHC